MTGTLGERPPSSPVGVGVHNLAGEPDQFAVPPASVAPARDRQHDQQKGRRICGTLPLGMAH
jgi:hypothetical protein